MKKIVANKFENSILNGKKQSQVFVVLCTEIWMQTTFVDKTKTE